MYWKVTWVDQAFHWNPATYEGIDSTYMPVSAIWSPDLLILNGRGYTRTLGLALSSDIAELFSDGSVEWWPGRDTEISCSFDITKYPFDIQNCSLEVEKWYLDDTQQSLEPIGNHIDTGDYQENGEWDLVDTSVTISVYQEGKRRVYWSIVEYIP